MIEPPNSYYDPPEEPEWCTDCEEYRDRCECYEDAQMEREIDNYEDRLEAEELEGMNAEVEWESPY